MFIPSALRLSPYHSQQMIVAAKVGHPDISSADVVTDPRLTDLVTSVWLHSGWCYGSTLKMGENLIMLRRKTNAALFWLTNRLAGTWLKSVVGKRKSHSNSLFREGEIKHKLFSVCGNSTLFCWPPLQMFPLSVVVIVLPQHTGVPALQRLAKPMFFKEHRWLWQII